MLKGIVGLSDEEVKESYLLHGDNSFHKEKKKGFFGKFFENLKDPIIRILIIAMSLQIIFTFGNCNYMEIIGILSAILLSTTVSTLSEYKSELAFEKLDEEAQSTDVSVLRGGTIKKIKIHELVVGDIVYLSVGEKIPADGKLLEGKLIVDQSALNGEGVECVKIPGNDVDFELSNKTKVFRGSVIADGSAVMKVERVGDSTYYGMVAKDVQTETRMSPLKLRLESLAKQISRIGYIVAFVVGVTFLFNSLVIDNGFDKSRIISFVSDFGNVFPVVLRTITLMITVIVVAAPEGLPMMITVVLSANMKRMIRDNILVKKMVGIETAGSMNILFTDKTGTLTVGKPQCDRIITYSGVYKKLNLLRREGAVFENLVLSARYNTDVVSDKKEAIGGNGTDRAIYDYFREVSASEQIIVEKIPFKSERKYSSVKLKNGKSLIKGAAELILKKTKFALNEKGETVPFLSERVSKDYYEAVRRGERVLAVAISNDDGATLTFIALIVLKDKLRSRVIDAINDVLSAGIQIVMITGDAKETASAIAEECNIYNPSLGHIVLSSDEIRRMTDDEIKKILPKLRVVSRALPQDKTRLVRLSQELGLVVGMTGDGINDAPSLKLSDVGFSMGSGTDIAKSASDIVILDNSFLAISKTILYGRTIFKSIRKFITFQLIMNLCASGVSLLGQFIGIDTPITIIQMLWINIIMDTLGGLAFAGEAPEHYYMKEIPKSREEPILTKEILKRILFTGGYTLALCIVFLTSPVIRNMYGGAVPSDKFYTAFYALFVFSGIFNCFTSRCERIWLFSNIEKNKMFILIMSGICLIQCLMIYYGGAVFRCVPLMYYELSFVILLASSVVPFEIMRRLLFKLK